MSNEIAGLVVSVDSSSTRQAEGDLDKLASAGRRTEQSTKKVTDEFVKLTGKLFPATKTLATLERYQHMLNAKLKEGKIDAAQYAHATEMVTRKQTALKQALAGTTQEIDRGSRGWSILGKSIAGVTILGGLALTLRTIVRETSEAADVQAQLEARIRSTGGAAGQTLDSLSSMADELQRVTTIDDESIGKVQSVLMTFTRIGGTTFQPAVESVLNLSKAMSIDLNGAAKMVGKALNDPVAGITALSRAGVQFTDDQKRLIEVLVETGDTAGAQRVILAELETQMGGSARAARNTLGGAITSLKNNFFNLLEGDSSGDGVRGTVGAINNLTDTLGAPETQRAFASMIEGVFNLANAFAGLVTESGSAWESAQKWVNFKIGDVAGFKYGTGKDAPGQMKYDADRLRDKARTMQEKVEDTKALGKTVAPSYYRELTQTYRQLTAVEKERKAYTDLFGAPKPAGARPPAKPSVIDPPDASNYDLSTDDDKKARQRTADAVEAARKRREEEFKILMAGMLSEEDALRASYDKRKGIIEAATSAGSSERMDAMGKLAAVYAEEERELETKLNREVEQVRQSLLTEEQLFMQSIERRKAVVLKSRASPEEKAALAAQLEAERALYVQDRALRAEEAKFDLMSRYMTEAEFRTEADAREIDDLQRKLDKKLILEEDFQKAVAAIYERQRQAAASDQADKMQRVGDMFSALGQLANTFAKGQGKAAERMFKISKALDMASAIMGIASGIANAQKLVYPMNIIEGVRVAAVGAVQIATIKAQKFSGAYDKGGFIPAGSVGIAAEYGDELVNGQLVRGPARVTSRQATARMMAGAGSGGAISVETNVILQSDGTASTNTTASGAGENVQQARELGRLVSAKVREELTIQQRAGGILWNMGNGAQR